MTSRKDEYKPKKRPFKKITFMFRYILGTECVLVLMKESCACIEEKWAESSESEKEIHTLA